MRLLKKLGIVKSNCTSSKIFEELFDVPFYDLSEMKPHEYVNTYWSAYKSKFPDASPGINGAIFELIIRTLFVRLKFIPLYIQAKVAFVPNANFDAILYSQQQIPYSFSLKTSLRERYKQADLEGIALKYVHRRAKSYLLTLSRDEANNVKQKISKGEVIGLDAAILCDCEEFDNLIDQLKKEIFIEAGSIEIIESGMMVTQSTIAQIVNDN